MVGCFVSFPASFARAFRHSRFLRFSVPASPFALLPSPEPESESHSRKGMHIDMHLHNISNVRALYNISPGAASFTGGAADPTLCYQTTAEVVALCIAFVQGDRLAWKHMGWYP